MRRALPLLMAALGLCAACRDPATASGTALLAEITFDEALRIDQLAFTLMDEDGPGLDTAVRPDPAAGPLSSPQTLRFLLSDALAGRDVTLRVTGVREGVQVARGAGEATVVKGYEVALSIALSALSPEDGGTDGGIDGGMEVSCGPTTFAACGTATDGGEGGDGGVCKACDEAFATACVNGECRCGNSAECVPGQRCVSGFCVCDTCGPGQRCVGNMCVCDDVSCASGCCDEGVCRQRSLTTCGIQGSTCVSCTGIADTCTAGGVCQCGSTMPCPTGQRCQSGSCRCDAISCPNGCCSSAGECLAGTSSSACGDNGATCQSCSMLSTCVNQACI